MVNLTEFLDKNLAERPDKTALYFSQSETLSFRELYESVKCFTAGLNKLGFKQGDHIALSLGNFPEFVIAYLGIIRGGMVVVPLNIMMQKMELQHQLSDSEVCCFITSKRMNRVFNDIDPHLTQVRHVITVERDDSLSPQWNGIDLSHTNGDVCVSITPDSVAQITYTAATDGYAKGAMLTHGSMMANCNMTIKGMQTCDDDKYLSAIPLFHTYGAMANCLSPLAAGATVYLHSRFNPKEFFDCMEQHRITVLNGVPALYGGLLFHDNFDLRYFDSVRLMISGGAALPLQLAMKYRELGLELKEGYGLTECSPCVSVNPVHGRNKLTSIGIALEGIQLKIVDREGSECKIGEEGELLVKGQNVMKGYWKQPDLNNKTIIDGWLHTGDVAKKDEDDYYYLTGRLKAMLITGGFNVYFAEVERILKEYHKIRNVIVSAIPDPIQGELVKATISLKPYETATHKEIMHYAKRSMSIYKVPRVVEFLE